MSFCETIKILASEVMAIIHSPGGFHNIIYIFLLYKEGIQKNSFKITAKDWMFVPIPTLHSYLETLIPVWRCVELGPWGGPQSYRWRSHDGIRNTREQASTLPFSLLCVDSVRRQLSASQERALPENWMLDFTASRTAKNKYLVFKPRPLWDSIIATSTTTITNSYIKIFRDTLIIYYWKNLQRDL